MKSTNERKPMLFKLSTDKSMGEAAAALQAAVQANRFGVMQVHNLRETMTKKGVQFGRECLIFEVCQPQQAKKVLEENMSISTMLPCRISLYEEGGKTILASLKPTALLAMFSAPQLSLAHRPGSCQVHQSMSFGHSDRLATRRLIRFVQSKGPDKSHNRIQQFMGIDFVSSL
jgi:uncharacterized protein (DUF302 family)